MPPTASVAAAAAPAQVRLADPAVARFPRVHLGADISVGISAYGNTPTTTIALRALFNAAEGDFELILVDDCSPDNGELRQLFLQTRREHPNTRVFAFTRNLEYSGSLNCILSHARGRHVIFLSNDIFVTPAYLRELLALADASPDFGIIRGCSNFVDNGLATHNLTVPPLAGAEHLFQIGADVEARWRGLHLPDQFLTGDAFLVSRAVLDRIGTFDPMFYGYFADHDFGLRAQIAGFQLVLARGAFAYHQRASNFEYLPTAEREAKMSRRWTRVIENWARFKLKYGMPVDLAYNGSLNCVPWEELRGARFDAARHRVAGDDYSRYLAP